MAPLVGLKQLGAFFFPARGVLLRVPYLVVTAAAVILGALIALTPPLERAEWDVYDLYSRRIVRDADPAPSVVVVAIDEPSFAEVGLPWPWPRALHATLVDRLVEGGARTIAFDILFDVASGSPDDDRALADAIRRAGNVILANDQAAIEDRSYALTQWTDPIPVLAREAVSLGVIRIPYDDDGVLRRTPFTIEGRPAMPAAIAAREPGFTLPSDPERLRLIAFNGPPRQGILTVSYYQALDARASLPADVFRNKHVLIGRSLAATTIDEQSDHFTTPMAARMAGAEIHATILDNLLRRRFVADPVRTRGSLFVLCLVFGGLFGLAAFRLGPIAAPAAAFAVISVLFGASYVSLVRGVHLPLVAPAVTIATVYALTAAYRFGLVTSERRLIKRAFQHYVAPAIVEQMLNDPSKLKLGGDEYDVTVLFSDLEGFTALSERLSPAELTAHLSSYFKTMLDVLLAERGTLDKLIGDAIMMYFGAPIPDDRHPAQACRAALAMQRRMLDVNAWRNAQGLPPLRMRIGINSGRVVAGNMGTDTIFNYTILGDSVNLASRLEGVNKEYGTLILAGEDTWTRLNGAFEGREVDRIRVQGKERPVAIYELAAEAGALDETRRRAFALFASALGLYRAGNWRDARAGFERTLEVDPGDGPARTFAARCAQHIVSPPESWEGVHTMKTK